MKGRKEHSEDYRTVRLTSTSGKGDPKASPLETLQKHTKGKKVIYKITTLAAASKEKTLLGG